MKLLLFLALVVCVDAHGKLWLPKVYYVKSKSPYYHHAGYKHGLKYSSSFPTHYYDGIQSSEHRGLLGSSVLDLGQGVLSADSLGASTMESFPHELGIYTQHAAEPLGTTASAEITEAVPGLQIEESSMSAASAAEIAAASAEATAAANAEASSVSAAESADLSFVSEHPVRGNVIAGAANPAGYVSGIGSYLSHTYNHDFYHHFGRSHGYHYYPGTKRSYVLNRFYRVEPKFYDYHHEKLPYKVQGHY